MQLPALDGVGKIHASVGEAKEVASEDLAVHQWHEFVIASPLHSPWSEIENTRTGGMPHQPPIIQDESEHRLRVVSADTH